MTVRDRRRPRIIHPTLFFRLPIYIYHRRSSGIIQPVPHVRERIVCLLFGHKRKKKTTEEAEREEKVDKQLIDDAGDFRVTVSERGSL